MIRPSNDLLNFAIPASDGTIADVKNLCFDDDARMIRHLVVGAAVADAKADPRAGVSGRSQAALNPQP